MIRSYRTKLIDADEWVLKYMAEVNASLYRKTVDAITRLRSYSLKKIYNAVKDEPEYKELPKRVAQSTIKFAIRDYKVNGKAPKLKSNYYPLFFYNDAIRVKNGEIWVTTGRAIKRKYGVDKLRLKLPQKYQMYDVKAVVMVPRHNFRHYDVIVYYEAPEKRVELSENEFVSIDLGMYNFATIVSTAGDVLIIDGKKYMKRLDEFIAKLGRLQSAYAKQDIKPGKRYYKLLEKWNNYRRDFVNKAVKITIDVALKARAKTIVVGDYKNIKKGRRLPKNVRKYFNYLPHYHYLRCLKEKAREYGIEVVVVNEAYTSKADALALEPIEKSSKYSGRRVERGLFKSSTGLWINADVNGALNIMRKVAGDARVEMFLLAMGGRIARPTRVKIQ